MSARLLVVIPALLVIVGSAHAADSRNVLVFAPAVKNIDMDPADAALLQHAVEGDLGPAFAPLGFTVLTEETAKELLKNRNIDVEAVRQSNSYLEVARALKLSLFVTTQITSADGALTAEVRLFDVSSGNMLASEDVDGQDGASLRKSWKRSRDRFIGLAKQNLAGSKPAAADGSEAISAAELKELRAGCDRSEPSKCLRLGQLYEKGNGVQADNAKAVDYYGRACSGGYPEGCAALRTLRSAEQ